jgi:hypothetical protein
MFFFFIFAGRGKGASTVTAKETYKPPSFIDEYGGLQFEWSNFPFGYCSIISFPNLARLILNWWGLEGTEALFG